MENSTEVPQEIKTKTTIWCRNHTWGIFLRETKTQIQKDIHTTMFMAALLTIAKAWKPPKCPSTDKWIKKFSYIYIHIYMCMCVLVYIHNGLWLSHQKNNDTTTTWMDLEGIVLSEIQQTEKEKPYDVTCTQKLQNITSEQTQQKWTHPKNTLVADRR